MALDNVYFDVEHYVGIHSLAQCTQRKLKDDENRKDVVAKAVKYWDQSRIELPLGVQRFLEAEKLT